MNIRAKIWNSERPIYNSLPKIFGGFENETTNILTNYWDVLNIETKEKIESLINQVEIDQCDVEYLPLLAMLAGFSGEYNISGYSPDTIRLLIKNSFDFIWKFKGSEQVLRFILLALDIPFEIWKSSLLIADSSTVPHILGDNNLEYFIQLPLCFKRDSFNWLETVRIIGLYTPAYTNTLVCYDCFFADQSAVGEPVFDTPQLSIDNGCYPV